MRITTTLGPECRCHICGQLVDASSARGDLTPKPGDYAVCFQCGAVSTYDDNLQKVPVDESTIDPESMQEIEAFRRSIPTRGWPQA